MNSSKEMKRLMRRRFVPSHYNKDLHNKLHRLIQGKKSVDGYYKEMEISLSRASLNEDQEAYTTPFSFDLRNIHIV